MMIEWQRGDFVEYDGLPAVIVGLPGEGDIPEDHLALWFGEPEARRLSAGGSGNVQPIVWTVPFEYCRRAPPPIMRH